MKITLKIVFILIFTILLSSMVSLVSAETYNVNDQVNLGRYNIYCRQGSSYIRYMGIGQLNYMYYYRDYNNVEHKAFCLNLGMKGAEDGAYNVDANQLISDPKVASILISGSPYRTLAELGLNNEDEASFATQFAVWTYLNGLDLNQITPYNPGNENVVEAIKRIYYDGMNMKYTTEAIINVQKNGVAGLDNIDRNYYSQKYSISHNQNIKNINLSILGAENVRITDLNNNDISNITNISEFKILIPLNNITENKNIKINFRTEAKQTSVMFGATTISDFQNIGLLLDPVNFRTVQDNFDVSYQTSKINLRKIDKDSKNGVEGVTFRFETMNGKNLGEFKTDKNGNLTIDVQKDLKLYSEQNIKVSEINAPSNYIVDYNNTKNITIKWNQDNNLEFQNEKKKGQFRVIKVDLDNNEVKLKDVEFEVLDSNGKVIEKLVTDANGEAVSSRLPIDSKYTLRETKTKNNYVLSNENKIVELKQNEITNVTFQNEKKKGQIRVIKVDLDNNEVKLKNVEFEVLDSNGKVIEKLVTDINGEAVSSRLPIDSKYTLRETKTTDMYVLSEEVKTITLTQDKITNMTFENEMKKGKIKITKLSSEDNKYTNLSKNSPLKDVEFKVFDLNNKLVDTIITDENGIAITKDLIKGKYYIKESKQARYYLLNEDIYEAEIVNDKDIIEKEILNDSVKIDIEITKKGFIETQNKDNIYYNFKNIHNKSNVPLDNFTWNDTLPIDAVRLDKIYTGTWNEKLEYAVWYKTNKQDFKLFKDKLDSEIVYELDFNKIDLENDEYITEFEFRFGTVKIDFKEVESPIVYVNVLDNLKNGYIFTNHTKVSGDYLEEHIQDKDNWTTIIYTREVKLSKELPKTRFLDKKY